MNIRLKMPNSSTGRVPILLPILVFILLAGSQAQAQWTTDTSSNNIYYNSGNVGIGTTTPFGLFQVRSATNHNVAVRDVPGSGVQIYAANDANNAYNTLITDGAPLLLNPYSGGNVGIGTTSPDNLFDVSKSASGAVGAIAQITNPTSATGSAVELRLAPSSAHTIRYALITAVNATGNNDIALTFGSNFAERMRIDTSGNVGIGTTSPDNLFDVSKSASGTVGAIAQITNPTSATGSAVELRLAPSSAHTIRYALITAVNATGNNDIALTFGSNFAERMRIDTSGNVGIGITSPGAKLSVAGDVRATTAINAGSATSTLTGEFHAAGANAALTLESQTGSGAAWSIYDSAGTLNFYGGGATPQVVISNTGNITASGTIAAKYQDVAEWVPSSEQLAAGTVVVLDSTKSNQVTSSSVSYDTRVAGVISAQPGIALGEKSDSKVLVATTGRVKVKVDASKGPIHIGDLLVTSDVPGVAMKSEPIEFAGRKMHMPGTLIGKALEPLTTGKGEILVLLSLQ